jgi:hypothetical protein
MSFTRVVEDFVCEHCGIHVSGDGYTNHCPGCLWSKHVDVAPGDRAAVCGGLMKPVMIEGSSPEYVITHQCTACEHTRRNKVQREDSQDALLALVKAQADAS